MSISCPSSLSESLPIFNTVHFLLALLLLPEVLACFLLIPFEFNFDLDLCFARALFPSLPEPEADRSATFDEVLHVVPQSIAANRISFSLRVAIRRVIRFGDSNDLSGATPPSDAVESAIKVDTHYIILPLER